MSKILSVNTLPPSSIINSNNLIHYENVLNHPFTEDKLENFSVCACGRLRFRRIYGFWVSNLLEEDLGSKKVHYKRENI